MVRDDLKLALRLCPAIVKVMKSLLHKNEVKRRATSSWFSFLCFKVPHDETKGKKWPVLEVLKPVAAILGQIFLSGHSSAWSRSLGRP